MRKLSTVVLIFMTLIASAQTLSFEQAVSRLKKGNKKLQGMKKQEEAKDFALKSTESMFFPELTLNGSYVYMKDHLYLDMNELKTPIQGALGDYMPMLGMAKGQIANTLGAYKEMMNAQGQLLKSQGKAIGAIANKLIPNLKNPKDPNNIKDLRNIAIMNALGTLQQSGVQAQQMGMAFIKASEQLKTMGKMGLAGPMGKFKEAMAKDWKYKFQDQQIARFSLDLKYPIYTGGKIRTGVKVKKLEKEIAKVETKKTEDLLIAELAERYFQTQLAEEAIKVRETALEDAKLHLHDASVMEKNGILAPIQTMLAKTAVADANRELLGAKKDAELARTALRGILGGLEENITLNTFLFSIKGLKALEHYQNLAKDNYPDIIKAQLKKQMAEQNINFQRANFIPDVAIIGKKYIYTKNLPMTEPDDWYIGVGLKMNLFKGLQNTRKYREAKATDEAVALLIEQAQIDIQTLVKKHYTEILKQQEQLNSLNESLEFAEELVRVRNKAFKEGFATSTEVADANLYLSSIKIKRLNALFEIDKSLAKLLEVCGAEHTFMEYQ